MRDISKDAGDQAAEQKDMKDPDPERIDDWLARDGARDAGDPPARRDDRDQPTRHEDRDAPTGRDDRDRPMRLEDRDELRRQERIAERSSMRHLPDFDPRREEALEDKEIETSPEAFGRRHENEGLDHGTQELLDRSRDRHESDRKK